MKSNNFKIIMLLTFLFMLSINVDSNAQGRLNTIDTDGNNVTRDGEWGPTIVITTTVGGDYDKSKNSLFSIVGTSATGSTNSYRMVRVGATLTTAEGYADLDDAVNDCLANNYQRIIILEGEYSVDAPIVVDFLETTVSLPSATNVGNVGRITIEGEGFGTRIRGVGNINIFEVKSNYNSIKNRSI